METTVFLSNRSQAVRLPKAVALPENVKRVEVSDEPESLRLPERHGTNGSTETVSALILWITGNSLVCRKGSHSDAEVYARYQHLHFYDKEQTRQCQGTF